MITALDGKKEEAKQGDDDRIRADSKQKRKKGTENFINKNMQEATRSVI